MRLGALLRLAFASATFRTELNLATQINSPAHYAKGTPSSLAGLRLFVSMWFQVLLTPLNGVLFTIQSPYWFTIGRQIVFSLGRWSAQFHAGFHESDATLESSDCFRIHLQDYHLLWCDFPDASISTRQSYEVRNPRPKPGLGCSVFARRY